MKRVFNLSAHFSIFMTVLCFMFLLVSCSNRKTEEEEIFDANVKECMKPLVEQGVDVTQAKNICDCALKTMIAIDSSYLKMPPVKQKQFYSEHEKDIVDRCDELKKLISK